MLLSVYTATSGDCLAYEDDTTNYCAVCALSTDVRVVLPSKVICSEYAGTTCTGVSSTDNPIGYTYSLITLPNSPYEKICYSKYMFLQNVSKLGSDDLAGCSAVSDGTSSLSSSASDYMTWLFSNSYGCDTCESGYKRKTEYDTHLYTWKRSCEAVTATTTTTKATENSCTFTQYYDSSTKTCIDCDQKYGNCSSCNSTDCILCQNDHFYTSYKTQALATQGICLYRSCGLAGLASGSINKGPDLDAGHTFCYSCQLDNCNTCEITDGTQYCTSCKTGYYLDDNGDCQMQTALSSTEQKYNYFVAPFEGDTISLDNVTSFYNASNGTWLGNPLLFMQQALHAIYTLAPTVNKLDATIWLLKGNHHFFYCLDDLIPSYRAEVSYSYFCTNENMKHMYPKTDNVILRVRALSCAQVTTLGYTQSLYTNYCISDTGTTKPIVYVNSHLFYFNITKTAYFENIIFDGSNGLAYYYFRGTAFPGYNMWDYPLSFCTVSTTYTLVQRKLTLTNNTISGFTIPFGCVDSYKGSTIPDSSWECKTQPTSYQSTQRCSGEPYHEDFFKQDSTTGIYYLRRRVLFNLYTFDPLSRTNTNASEINIINCQFRYFLNGYESLIYVENNNYFSMGSNYSGLVGLRGENRGAGIVIQGSTFQNSRFCKGMIVFREPGFIMNNLLFNFTHALTSKYSNKYAWNSRIYITSSTFSNLNWASNVTHVAAVNTSYGNLKNISAQVHKSIQVPQFYHFGIVLNIDGFRGVVEMAKSTVTKNFIYIPEIYLYNHTQTRGYGIDQFMIDNLGEYAFAKCDQSLGRNTYLLAEGYSFDTDIESLFPKMERLSTIYISRNVGNMIFYTNTFYRNVAGFGGALTINSPNWQISSNKSYIILSANTFSQNQAYFSGNAVFIRQTKKYADYEYQCAGVFVESSTFSQNFGFVKHNGGAMTVYCDVLTDKKDVDYIASSEYTTVFILLQQYSDMIESVSDPIYTSISYDLYAYRTTVKTSTFSENFSGNKGLAAYFRYQSNVYIDECTFDTNYPVTAYYEFNYSPYYKYLTQSTRTILFYDEEEMCSSEYIWFQSCAVQGYYIDYPIAESTVRIEHCGESYCTDENMIQQTTITDSTFYANDVGPYLNMEFMKSRATAVYISNAKTTTISKNTFYSHAGDFSFHMNYTFYMMNKFMPTGYFTYANAPIVRVEISTESPEYSYTYATTFSSNTFKENKNYQIIGQFSEFELPPEYYGALIEYVSNMRSDNNIISTVAFTSNTFKDNIAIGPNMGLIYVENGIITASSNTFTNNGYLGNVIRQNTVSNVNKGTTYFSYNSYYINETLQYGGFYVKIKNQLPSNYYNQFTGNKFSYTFAYQGGAYFIKAYYSFPFVFTGNSYNFNFADHGSVLEANFNPPTSTSYIYYQLESEQIRNQYSRYFGALYFSESNNQQAIKISNSNFTNCQGYQGAAIAVQSGGAIYCVNCKFNMTNYNYTNKTTQILASYSGARKILSYIYYKELDILQSTVIYQGYTYFQNSYNNIKGTVKLGSTTITQFSGTYSKYINFINCTFTYLNGTMGTAIYSTGSKIYVTNKNRPLTTSKEYLMAHNNASLGVVYIANYSELIMTNSTIYNNTGVQGSFIYAQTNSFATVNNTLIQSNNATNQGTFYISDGASLVVNSCNMTLNRATLDSSIIFALQTSDDPGVTISNSQIYKNYAYANTFTILFSVINIKNTLMYDNICTNLSHGFTSYNSIVNLYRDTITYTRPDIDLYENNADYGFFNINYKSFIYINNCTISNLRGKKASALFVQGDSNATVNGSTIFQNTASTKGRIMGFASANVIIFDDVTLTGNPQINMVADSVTLYLNRTTMTGSSSLLVKATNSYVYVNSSTLQESSNTDILGGGIYCNCYVFQSYNTTYSKLQSYYGGALHLLSLRGSIFTLTQNVFKYNNASKGGAIYVFSANQVRLINNYFLNNSANLYTDDYIGGALYYQCPVYIRYLACNLTLESANAFVNNTSSAQGGAIAWVNKRYVDLDNSTVFINNTATYGAKVSSFAKAVTLSGFDSNDPTSSRILFMAQSNDPDKARILQATTDSNYNVVSGTELSFKLILYDQDGQQMTSETKSVATLYPSDWSAVVYLYGNQVQAAAGVYDFSNVELSVKPGEQIAMYLMITGLSTYGNDVSISSVPINFTFSVRSCVAGEEYTSKYICVTCPVGKYSFFAPTTFSSCSDCDIHAICYGGSIVTPQNGYWRSKNTSENFIACPNSASCLAGNETEPLGICADGYEGILCSQCKKGYIQAGKFECGVCQSRMRITIEITFVFVVGVWLIYIFVKNSLSAIVVQKPLFIVYCKIMLNHLHMIGIILSITFNWPSVVSTWMEVQKEASGFSNFAFQIECFLIGEDTDYSTDGKSYYLKLVLYGILPVILTIFVLVGWGMYCSVKKDWTRYRSLVVSTLVIVFYIAHPAISRELLSAVNCMEVEGDQRLFADLSQICFVNQHLSYAIGFAIPLIIVWVIIIPFFWLFTLIKNRQSILQIESQDVQSKADKAEILRVRSYWGFLFNGFQLHYYYWEIIILFRKIILIIIMLFLQTLSSQAAILICIIILVLNQLVHAKIKPYYSPTLNALEQYSMMSCMVTLYFGLFYLRSEGQSFVKMAGVKYFFFSCILLPNAAFYFTWFWNTYIELLRDAIRTDNMKSYQLLTCGFWPLEKFKKRYLPDSDSMIKESESEGAEEQEGSEKDEKPIYDPDRILDSKLNEEEDEDGNINIKKLLANMNNEKDFIQMIGGEPKKTKRGMGDEDEDYGNEDASSSQINGRRNVSHQEATHQGEDDLQNEDEMFGNLPLRKAGLKKEPSHQEQASSKISKSLKSSKSAAAKTKGNDGVKHQSRSNFTSMKEDTSMISQGDIQLEPKDQKDGSKTNRKVYPLEKLKLDSNQAWLRDDSKYSKNTEKKVDQSGRSGRSKREKKNQFRFHEGDDSNQEFAPQPLSLIKSNSKKSNGSNKSKRSGNSKGSKKSSKSKEKSANERQVPIEEERKSQKRPQPMIEIDEERKTDIRQSEFQPQAFYNPSPNKNAQREIQNLSPILEDDIKRDPNTIPSRDDDRKHSFGSLEESKIKADAQDHKFDLSDILVTENLDQMLTPHNHQEHNMDFDNIDGFSLNDKSQVTQNNDQMIYDPKTKTLKNFHSNKDKDRP